MKSSFRLIVLAVIAVGLLAGTVGAAPNPDARQRMNLLYTNPNNATNSDLAFLGNHAFIGYYTGDTGSPAGSGPRGGVRIFDIKNPAKPTLVKDIACDANQNDPIVWDRNGNGVADLLLLAVDRTMESTECGAARSMNADGTPNHGDPDGWEGVRVFELSDDPANPFATVTQVASVYTDCGAHTITLWPGNAEGPDGSLIVYVSSYPLRPGPTCGDTEHLNTANPYDGDPGSPANPLHGVIQVIEVPLNDPAAAEEIAQPEISYPGDPDARMEWCEKGLCPPAFEPAAVACHDIVVHVESNMAGAACAEQGQVWEIDPDTGIPDTANPVSIIDDEVSSGGTGNIPGAVDFFHSVMFNNDGTVLNTVDESFGVGCPPMTTYASRPWNPAGGTHKTGRMFFSDTETGEFFSEFQVGDVRPDPTADAYCSAHMGMAIMDIRRDLLVNAWYSGGVDVIDFTDPENLEEIAWYDIAGPSFVGSDNWSAYPYVGPRFKNGGTPIYASDGVHVPPNGRGFVVFRFGKAAAQVKRDILNPQTMD